MKNKKNKTILFSQNSTLRKLKVNEVIQKNGATNEFKIGVGNFDRGGINITTRLNKRECRCNASGLLMDCFFIKALL